MHRQRAGAQRRALHAARHQRRAAHGRAARARRRPLTAQERARFVASAIDRSAARSTTTTTALCVLATLRGLLGCAQPRQRGSVHSFQHSSPSLMAPSRSALQPPPPAPAPQLQRRGAAPGAAAPPRCAPAPRADTPAACLRGAEASTPVAATTHSNASGMRGFPGRLRRTGEVQEAEHGGASAQLREQRERGPHRRVLAAAAAQHQQPGARVEVLDCGAVMAMSCRKQRNARGARAGRRRALQRRERSAERSVAEVELQAVADGRQQLRRACANRANDTSARRATERMACGAAHGARRLRRRGAPSASSTRPSRHASSSSR